MRNVVCQQFSLSNQSCYHILIPIIQMKKQGWNSEKSPSYTAHHGQRWIWCWLRENALSRIMLPLCLFKRKQHPSSGLNEVKGETQIPLGIQVPFEGNHSSISPCKPLPETASVVQRSSCKNRHRPPGSISATTGGWKPRVVIRKLNNFTDKLKAWEAAGETGHFNFRESRTEHFKASTSIMEGEAEVWEVVPNGCASA